MVSVSLVYSVSIVPNLLCLLVPFPHPPLSLSSLPFILYALTQTSLKGHCFNALPLKYPAASLKVLRMYLLPRSSQSADLAPACPFCRMQCVSSQHQSGLLQNLASEYRVPTCHQWGGVSPENPSRKLLLQNLASEYTLGLRMPSFRIGCQNLPVIFFGSPRFLVMMIKPPISSVIYSCVPFV